MESTNSQTTKVLRSKRMDGLVKRNATYADLEDIPENKVGELIEGNLYIHSRPRVAHSRAITQLVGELVPAMRDRRRGWVILTEVEIWLNKQHTTVLVPDLAGYQRERMPEIPDVQTLELVPDWVCEGLSPSTALHDKGRKLDVYRKNKIPHVWYVDPTLKTLEIFTYERGGYRITTVAGNQESGSFPPFTHEIDLAVLWQR